jgi:hypothetical protein
MSQAIPEGSKLILELKAIINKYGVEHGLTLAEAIGMIEIAKRDIMEEAIARASMQMKAEAEKADADTVLAEIIHGDDGATGG